MEHFVDEEPRQATPGSSRGHCSSVGKASNRRGRDRPFPQRLILQKRKTFLGGHNPSYVFTFFIVLELLAADLTLDLAELYEVLISDILLLLLSSCGTTVSHAVESRDDSDATVPGKAALW